MNDEARRRFCATLVVLVGLAFGASASADPGTPLRLISPEEAALEDAPVFRGSRDLEEGPTIQLVSPKSDSVYKLPFPIEVIFRVGPNGLAIDPDSVKVYYKKLWDIVKEEAKASAGSSGELNIMVGKYHLTAKAGKTFRLNVEVL